jgi:hypothetical protein
MDPTFKELETLADSEHSVRKRFRGGFNRCTGGAMHLRTPILAVVRTTG